MTEQTEPKTPAAPARIELEDFIEAVTRGVTRALAAQDEVSGYLLQGGGDPRSTIRPTILTGIIALPPPTFPDLSGSQGTLARS